MADGFKHKQRTRSRIDDELEFGLMASTCSRKGDGSVRARIDERAELPVKLVLHQRGWRSAGGSSGMARPMDFPNSARIFKS